MFMNGFMPSFDPVTGFPLAARFSIPEIFGQAISYEDKIIQLGRWIGLFKRTLQDALCYLQTNVEKQGDKIAALETYVNEQMAALNASMTDLENKVGTYDDKLAAMQAAIDNVIIAMSAFNTELDQATTRITTLEGTRQVAINAAVQTSATDDKISDLSIGVPVNVGSGIYTNVPNGVMSLNEALTRLAGYFNYLNQIIAPYPSVTPSIKINSNPDIYCDMVQFRMSSLSGFTSQVFVKVWADKQVFTTSSLDCDTAIAQIGAIQPNYGLAIFTDPTTPGSDPNSTMLKMCWWGSDNKLHFNGITNPGMPLSLIANFAFLSHYTIG